MSYTKEYYKNNKEKIKKQATLYYQLHFSEYKIYQHNYYLEHRFKSKKLKCKVKKIKKTKKETEFTNIITEYNKEGEIILSLDF